MTHGMTHGDFILWIRRNSDGEVRRRVLKNWYAAGVVYNFQDGNWACDCNRHLEFERAVDPTYDQERSCGHTAYTVLRILDLHGNTVYAET